MIKPLGLQTILNFSALRFINEVSPVFQIDTLLRNIVDVSDKFTSSEFTSLPFRDIGITSGFGRHLVEHTTYSDGGQSKGYSQPKLMGYLTQTHSAEIDVDNISGIMHSVKEYTGYRSNAVYNANKIHSALKPYIYILTDYNMMSMLDISKVITTVNIEDTAVSDISMINLLSAYGVLLDVSNSIFKTAIFSNGSLPSSNFRRYLFNQATNQTSGVTASDLTSGLTNFLSSGSSSNFYSGLTAKILTVTSTKHASQAYKDNLQSTIQNAITGYFVNGAVNFIDRVAANYDRILISIISMYSDRVISNIAYNLLFELYPDMQKEHVTEKEVVRSIYDYYLSYMSDDILSVESECSAISLTSVDLLNTHTHFYTSFISGLEYLVERFKTSIITPSKIQMLGAIDVPAVTTLAIQNASFATASGDNLKILNSAISDAVTLEFGTYIESHRLNSDFFSAVIDPIITAAGTKISIGSVMSDSDFADVITGVIVSTFNVECYSNTYSMLPNFQSKIQGNFDYTLPITPQGVADTFTSTYASNTNNTSSTISRAVIASVFTTIMNANLDDFAV